MVRRAALLVDFGSTYTKLAAVDLDGATLLARAQGPSTVATDVTVGFHVALDRLHRHLGEAPRYEHRLACSSAAGGLRMVTVGLVPEMTVQAARHAALGAGAKVVGTFAYRLTAKDIEDVRRLGPDVLLLAGGTDGGNAEVLLHNAAALAAGGPSCPVVLAGNRVVADEAASTLRAAGREVVVAGNVMPELNRLHVDPAREAIRDLFIRRIVHAKGIDRAAGLVDVLMPTPTAVLEAAQLLAEGVPGQGGLGDLVVVDVGGATTDVHSVCSGLPSRPEVVYRGLPEPRVKRTVEGDLGLRHNAATILEAVGAPALSADGGLTPPEVEQGVARLAADVERLPADDAEGRLDVALARAAVRIAVGRHAGRYEVVYTPLGETLVQYGKDLTDVRGLVGTGGVFAASPRAADVLAAALRDPRDAGSLRPTAPRLYLDRSYVLYAAGLLATVEPHAALTVARRYLQPVEGGGGSHGVG